MSLSQSGARSQPDLLNPQEARVRGLLGGIATTVTGNTASDNSNFFAGPIADKVINNYNFNLFVGNHGFDLSGNSSRSDLLSRSRSATTPPSTSHRQVAPNNAQTSPISKNSMMGLPQISQEQYVTIFSKPNTENMVLAQLRSDVRENWISYRIVSSLKLESHADASGPVAYFDGTPLRSAGNVVSLHCSSGRSGKLRRHTFYVVRDRSCDFDLLLGADILFSEEKT